MQTWPASERNRSIAHDAAAGPQRERRSRARVGGVDRDAENLAVGKLAVAGVGNQPEELKQDARFVVAGDKVPLPWRRTTRFSASSSSSALRTVPCDTPRSAAISNSLGSAAPGCHSPSTMRLTRTSRSLPVERAEAERLRPFRRARLAAAAIRGSSMLAHLSLPSRLLVSFDSSVLCLIEDLTQRTAKRPGRTMAVPQFLVHDKKDTVGVVVVEGLKAGTDMLCVVTADNSDLQADRPRWTCRSATRSRSPTSRTATRSGNTARTSARPVADIAKGEHVHVHNLKTKRW